MAIADPSPNTPRRLLDAALASFAARGYEATSLDQVASEAGVRKQTLLYHFSSKESLLEAVIDLTVIELADQVRPALDRPIERRRAVIDALLRVGTHRPELLELVREALRLGPPASDHLRLAAEPFVAALATELPREKVFGTVSIILGLATEADVATALGVPGSVGQLRRRRHVLLEYLAS